jgi:hypothetical protein
MRRRKAEFVAVAAIDISKRSAADADGILEHSCKNWLKIARRAADHLKNLRRRRLLLQRFGQIGSALAQLIQQPRVLDGDDRLTGEVRHERDLFVGKRTNFLAIPISVPTIAILQHGHRYERPHVSEFDRGNDCTVEPLHNGSPPGRRRERPPWSLSYDLEDFPIGWNGGVAKLAKTAGTLASNGVDLPSQR